MLPSEPLGVPFTDCYGSLTKYPSPVKEFKTVEDARHALQMISYYWLRFMYSAKPDYSKFLTALDEWRGAFADFQNLNGKNFKPLDRRGLALLELHSRQVRLILTMIIEEPESSTWWDAHGTTLSEMVDYAAASIELSENLDISQPIWSIDAFVNVHLYCVASWSRDPLLRRKAVATIRAGNRYEGFWKADLAATVAQRIIELEEEGLGAVRSCHDVPVDARLQGIKLTLDPAGMKALLQYKIRNQIIDEYLEWRESTV
jgi:hypothetical protein